GPGAYFLQVTATGNEPVIVHLTVALGETTYESLLQNGVGQGPALSLRLITPTLDLTDTPFGAPSASPPPSAGPGAASPRAVAAAMRVQVPSSHSALDSFIFQPMPLSSPGNLFLTVESDVIGLPGAAAPGAAAVVNVATTSFGTGLGQAISPALSPNDFLNIP